MRDVFCVNRLDVKGGELGKETLRRDTGSLGAGSDCASTRGMAGSITSSYTITDRDVHTHTHTHTHSQNTQANATAHTKRNMSPNLGVHTNIHRASPLLAG